MSAHQALLNDDIEPDEDVAPQPANPSAPRRGPVVLSPTNRPAQGQMATNSADAESGAWPRRL
jgi:hypothetical protein